MKKVTVLLPLIFLILLALPAPASAQGYMVRAGGSYTVVVMVNKPASLRLYDGTWEIRAYFYNGMNCFNSGYWWSSGSDWIYSGWYGNRYLGDDWATESTSRTFQIPVTIVNIPRPDADKTHGMEDLQYGDSLTLRVRLLIKGLQPTFSGSPDEGTGTVAFTIGGTNYRYQYSVDEYGTINVIGQDLLNAKLDIDTTDGTYRLIIDHDDVGAEVTELAPSTDTFDLATPLALSLSSFTSPETSYNVPQELQIALSVVAVLVAVGAGAYFGLRKKPEELPPE